MLLIAPAPPPPAATMARSSAARSAHAVLLALQPMVAGVTHLRHAEEADPPGALSGDITGVPGGTGWIASILGPTAPQPVVRQAIPKQATISSGVMAGNKISGSAPAYPAIAKAARIQGTVVLAAVISPSGSIQNLRILSGPPMLTASALEAVRQWRYRPYLLNGQPVAVETTINIVFSLGG